jgi:hypothetical protein
MTLPSPLSTGEENSNGMARAVPLDHSQSGPMNRQANSRSGHKILFVGSLIVFTLLACSFLWLQSSLAEPQEAPEAERVLNAQAEVPFQVLIPAYLPRGFNRAQMQIDTTLPGPAGEPMIQLTYATREGYTLVLREWRPRVPGPDQSTDLSSTSPQPRIVKCRCQCQSRTQCDMREMQVSIDGLHINVQLSVTNLVSMQELQFILNTLGPATNQQVYSSLEDVPVTYSLPPAVEVPINADGIQEVTLVVNPQGYSPAHFAVQRDVPVRLIFKQLGEVGCGNELLFQWSTGQSAELKLASTSDAQILEFTPAETGDFRFNCPHLIYVGGMTVQE